MTPPLAALRRKIDSSWPVASLRAYLVAVILLATLPTASLMGYWVVTDVVGQEKRMRRELQQSADAIARIVDRELVSSIDALTRLAGSAALQRHDLAAFEEALRGSRQRPQPGWFSVYLLDRDGDLLFDTSTIAPGRYGTNTAPPLFRPPPLSDKWSESLPEAMSQTRSPTIPAARAARVSGRVDGRAPEQYAVAIEVPVIFDSSPRYFLGAWIAAPTWQDLVQMAGVPPGAVAGIRDREHRLIAQSEDPGDGRQPRDNATAPTGPVAAGTAAEPPTANSVLDARKPITLAGWEVDVSLPAGPLDDRQIQAIVAAFGTGTACLIFGILLALLMGRRLTRPLHDLTANPQQVLDRIVVREVAQLRDALLAARAIEETTLTRLEAKRDLLQSKADEFETLFESSPIGLAFAQDPECREVLHNAAMNALFGPPTAPSPVRVLNHGQPLERHNQPLQRAAAFGESAQGLELELQVEGQPPKFALVNAVPLTDSNGRPRGALSAVVDITERKRAEARLANTEKNLRESRRLIDLAQEAGNVGFFHYRFETDALVWTPGLCKLFGMAPMLRESNLEYFLARIGGEYRERIEKALRDTYAVHREKETLDFRVVLPSGARRWLSSRIMVNYGDDGRPQQMIGVTLDISDQREAERGRAALIQREHAARIEAEAANRAKDEFLAMLGHELRNPLSAISAAIEVLNHADARAESAVSARGIIARQTSHLARLMDDLLDVARVIFGKILLTRQSVNLAELMERLVATLKLTGTADRHQLDVELDEVWIDADPTRIEQVVNNLLTNALKYTPAGGRIALRVRAEGEQAVLEVSDTGVGISPALLPQIFDLFVQAERTLDRRAGGLGIGLTLVRRLVELHGGTVTAASSVAGTVFTVRLPAVEAPADAAERKRVPPSHRRRVGLIEDNEDALDSLQEMLELDGHTVFRATDGVSGLALLLEHRPDVAVVDIGLPGLTGLEVARQSRAAGYSGRMIALSGYSQYNDEQALAAGFDAYLVKPVDADRLRRMLAEK